MLVSFDINVAQWDNHPRGYPRCVKSPLGMFSSAALFQHSSLQNPSTWGHSPYLRASGTAMNNSHPGVTWLQKLHKFGRMGISLKIHSVYRNTTYSRLILYYILQSLSHPQHFNHLWIATFAGLISLISLLPAMNSSFRWSFDSWAVAVYSAVPDITCCLETCGQTWNDCTMEWES